MSDCPGLCLDIPIQHPNAQVKSLHFLQASYSSYLTSSSVVCVSKDDYSRYETLNSLYIKKYVNRVFQTVCSILSTLPSLKGIINKKKSRRSGGTPTLNLMDPS